MIALLVSFAFGYICGSVPFGVIATRLAGAVDPRSVGSMNIGATNVLRTGRKDLAAITLLADALKGTVAVLVARYFDNGANPIPLDIAAAGGAFLGHVFPLFLRFRGGKGVATFLGCLVAIAWPAGLVFALVWLAVAFATRYSSAAALTASVAAPTFLALIGRHEAALLFVFLTVIIWINHRANITRLLAGSESRIGEKAGGVRP